MFCAVALCAAADQSGIASWYGFGHQGRLMANNRPFDCRKLTAASWFYPLGTKVIVRHKKREVVVSISDRGPSKDLVARGRIIDLSLAAFKQLDNPKLGLIAVTVEEVR